VNAIRSVFLAFANLAASVNALAQVIDAATGRLRQQLAFEEPRQVIEHNTTPGAQGGCAPENENDSHNSGAEGGSAPEPASNGKARNRKASTSAS
jgi:hypothetical protein